MTKGAGVIKAINPFQVEIEEFTEVSGNSF